MVRVNTCIYEAFRDAIYLRNPLTLFELRNVGLFILKYSFFVCLVPFVLIQVIFLQLLALTIQLEKPELEVKKTELLRKEEELKVQLAGLEETLLEVNIFLSSLAVITEVSLILIYSKDFYE